MDNKVKPIISATSLINALVEAVEKIGGSIEAIYRLATPEGAETLKRISEIIVKGNQSDNPFSRLISGSEKLTIEALSGKEIVVKAEKTFSLIGPNFRIFGLDKLGKATKETEVVVREITADATFAQMFDSLPGGKEKQAISQNQFLRFLKKYRRWLCLDGSATLFLIEEEGRYFVVDVYVRDDGLDVDVRRFEYDYVWSAEYRHRLVVRQLVP
jgi:hypothetical protein